MTTSSDRAARRGSANSIMGGLSLVERGIDYMGRATAWLTLALVLLVCLDVAMRYLFQTGSVAQQELQWHLLAVIAMLSAAYTFQQGDHVRVDILYQYYSPGTKIVFDIVTNLLVVVPVMLFLAWISLGFVEQSWMLREGSPDPSGLPARYVIKAFVPLGFALVALQGLVRGLLDLSGLLRAGHKEQTHGH